MNLDSVPSDISFLRAGLHLTIELTLLSLILAAVLGLLLALGRLSSNRMLSAPSALYVNFFLSTPILIQLIWIYYVVPQQTGLLLSDIEVLVLALGLHTAASMSEVYRGGLLAVDPGQRDAARVLGLSRTQTLRFVVLPQAVRFMLPPIASVLIDLVKDSSLATFIGANDLLNSGRTLAINTFKPVEVFTVVAIGYFVLTYPISLAGQYLERRAASSYR